MYHGTPIVQSRVQELTALLNLAVEFGYEKNPGSFDKLFPYIFTDTNTTMDKGIGAITNVLDKVLSAMNAGKEDTDNGYASTTVQD